MNMYEGVLNRVRQIEEKNGIKYAKTDGKLFKTLKFVNMDNGNEFSLHSRLLANIYIQRK